MTEAVKKIGNYRWTICALIFFATTINYLDRQVIGILKPLLESDLDIGEKAYSHIVMAFQFFYAFGMVVTGRLIDKWGTKIGYGIAVIFWSLAAMGHALAKGALGFGFWRSLPDWVNRPTFRLPIKVWQSGSQRKKEPLLSVF